MFHWIYDLPNVVVAILFSVVSVAFTWAGVLATRPMIRRRLGPEPACNELVSYFLSSYGVFYGLTLGLLAVGTYENFSDVESTVGKEASSLSALYHDVSSYPMPVRAKLQELLRDYTRYVIEEAWPDQKRGIIPSGGIARIEAFQRLLLTVEPATLGQAAMHAETLRQYNIFLESRRQRLQSVTTALPAVLWCVVLVGAIVNVMLTWLFSVDRLWVHLALTGLLALLIALLIFLLAIMDNPFLGEFSVSPEPFEIIQKTIMTSSPGAASVP